MIESCSLVFEPMERAPPPPRARVQQMILIMRIEKRLNSAHNADCLREPMKNNCASHLYWQFDTTVFVLSF